MNFRKSLFIGLMTLPLSGCFDPQNYETEPVRVETRQGVVTCQLYTRERVLWDRSIHRPETMSVETADQVCRAEGARQVTGNRSG